MSQHPLQKIALISRDGVINQWVEGGVNHRTQLQWIPNSIEALASLSRQGYTLIVVTHQPGISRGLLDLDELEAIHNAIHLAVEKQEGNIAAFFYCPHDEQDQCHCHPPKIGLLDVIEIEFDCDTKDAYFFCYTEQERQMAEQKGCHILRCDQDKNLSSQVNQLLINT